MKLELFSLSDYAQELQGKLVIVGTFDVIRTQKFPAFHPQCSIAIKIRYTDGDQLDNNFKICIVGRDATKPLFNVEGGIHSENPEKFETYSANIVINVNGLNFEYEGTYKILFYINNKLEGELPLYLKKI